MQKRGKMLRQCTNRLYDIGYFRDYVWHTACVIGLCNICVGINSLQATAVSLCWEIPPFNSQTGMKIFMRSKIGDTLPHCLLSGCPWARRSGCRCAALQLRRLWLYSSAPSSDFLSLHTEEAAVKNFIFFVLKWPFKPIRSENLSQSPQCKTPTSCVIFVLFQGLSLAK